MFKKLIKKYLPDPATLRQHPSMQRFDRFLHDPYLWHLNRRSVRNAFAMGLFAALMPMPGQTVLATILAIWARGNIPVAIALCWLTNPLTMAPIFYICFNIGSIVLQRPPLDVEFQANADWILSSMEAIGLPFLVGSLIFAAAVSTSAYYLINWIWIASVRRSRKHQLAARKP